LNHTYLLPSVVAADWPSHSGWKAEYHNNSISCE